MILVFSDDGKLALYAKVEQVLMHCNSIDVDAGVYAFYDDQGRALIPIFDVPVETKQFLWFFESVVGGEYHLELDTSGNAEHILFALLECSCMEPSLGFENLDQVKSFLRNQDVIVDAPDLSAT